MHFSVVLEILKWQTIHNNTRASMDVINLQATGVLDDLAHFRYAKCRSFSDHARFFLSSLVLLNDDIKLTLSYFE